MAQMMKSIHQPDLDIQKLTCKGNAFNRAEQDLNQSLSNKYNATDLCVAVRVEMRQGVCEPVIYNIS